MPAAEHLLKGLFVALALHAGIWASADPSARWGMLAAIDGIAMAGLVVSLGWAAMRTAPGRNRPLAHLMFLLLKHGAMVRGGLVGGMVAGALALASPDGQPGRELLALLTVAGLAAGAMCGLAARQRRAEARLGLALGVALVLAAAAVAAGLAPWRAEGAESLLPARLDMLAWQILFVLVMLPVLDIAAESPQTKADAALWCALLGLGLWLPSRQGPPALVFVVLVLPVVVFALVARTVLPGWASFKMAFKGRALARQGDLPGALACFRQALRLNPSDKMAREGYWRTHLELEPEGVASDPLARRLIHPGDCLHRASELLTSSPPQLTDAYRLLNLAEKLDPALAPLVSFWMAVALLHEKRDDEACARVRPLLEIPGAGANETDLDSTLLAWRLTMAWHKGARARLLEGALARPGARLAAIAAIERGLAADAADSELWAIKRELYSGLDNAEFRAGRDLGLPPGDPVYLDEIAAALAGDDSTWKRAASYMAMAVEAGGSRMVRRLIALARLLEARGDEDGSRARFRQAAEAGRAMGPEALEPEDKDLYFRAARHQAELAEHEGRGADAIGWWQATLASDRSGIETLRRLAALHEAAGDPLSALKDVVKGLIYQADDKDLLERRDRYLWSIPLESPACTAEGLKGLVDPVHCVRKAKGILDDRRGDPEWLEVAEHLLALADRVDPGNLMAKALLSRARLRLGDRDAAIAGFEAVRAAKPTGLFQGDGPEAWQLANQALGDLYLEVGRPAEAIACLADFRDSPRSGAATLFKLGQAHEELGELAKARSYYRQVTGYEDNPLAWQAREAIDRLSRGAEGGN